jgi:hypothetical protein
MKTVTRTLKPACTDAPPLVLDAIREWQVAEVLAKRTQSHDVGGLD